jgi:hypothetical protein
VLRNTHDVPLCSFDRMKKQLTPAIADFQLKRWAQLEGELIKRQVFSSPFF